MKMILKKHFSEFTDNCTAIAEQLIHRKCCCQFSLLLREVLSYILFAIPPVVFMPSSTWTTVWTAKADIVHNLLYLGYNLI